MTDIEKIALIADMMELEQGKLAKDTVLNSLNEWDSLAVLSFVAMMDEEFGKDIKGCQVRECKTVADLMNLMVK
ncbi:MAG: hypothetical protein KBS60_02900 [Phascolarctobacterium sp.]|nr:hypothetical protein [Candidatus Phascolarctobacterium caballi]